MIQTKTMAVVLLMSIAIIGTIGASQAAFADGNQCVNGVCPGNAGAPGQNFGNPTHTNPSSPTGPNGPPGQSAGPPTGVGGENSGQCQKSITSGPYADDAHDPGGCFRVGPTLGNGGP